MIELQADDRGPAGGGSPSNFYPIEGEVAGLASVTVADSPVETPLQPSKQPREAG